MSSAASSGLLLLTQHRTGNSSTSALINRAPRTGKGFNLANYPRPVTFPIGKKCENLFGAKKQAHLPGPGTYHVKKYKIRDNTIRRAPAIGWIDVHCSKSTTSRTVGPGSYSTEDKFSAKQKQKSNLRGTMDKAEKVSIFDVRADDETEPRPPKPRRPSAANRTSRKDNGRSHLDCGGAAQGGARYSREFPPSHLHAGSALNNAAELFAARFGLVKEDNRGGVGDRVRQRYNHIHPQKFQHGSSNDDDVSFIIAASFPSELLE
jgi:hypothetical protein